MCDLGGKTCHSGHFRSSLRASKCCGGGVFLFFEEDGNVRRGKAEKYQEHTAMWISGTPQSSAGPCSQTPWCSPRLLDNPEKTKRETLLFHFTHHLQA